MPATIARQWGWELLEQTNMCLALNMAKIAKVEFSYATIDWTQYLITPPCPKAFDVKLEGVRFPRHDNVKPAIVRHLAMLRQNDTDGCIPMQCGTAHNLQELWRRNRVGAPPPDWLRQETTAPMPPLPVMPTAPPGHNVWALASEIGSVSPRYVYIRTPLPRAQFFNLGTYAKNCKHDQEFNTALLTGEESTTG